MNFATFIDFLNCLYINEVEAATRVNNQERIARMVFEGSFDTDINDPQLEESSRRQAMRTARCVKMMGRGVVKVVHRCDDAKENNTLDLSDCQLQQIPDAVFLLMANTTLTSCNLAHNVISKIPAKLAMKFINLMDLDVSGNRISALPEELSNCTALETVNISSNSFIQLPPVLANIPSLIKLIARNNFIADVEVEALEYLPNLEHINLEGNPLKKSVHDSLSTVTSVRVVLSPREQEEWEDLSC
jgi:Leucine-rich repeat (LRR) protein